MTIAIETTSTVQPTQPIQPQLASHDGVENSVRKREETPGLIKSTDARRALKARFKSRARDRSLTALDMAARCLLLGNSLDAAFTPVTNPVKLANGRSPGDTMREQLRLMTLRRKPSEPVYGLDWLGLGEDDSAALQAAAARERQARLDALSASASKP